MAEDPIIGYLLQSPEPPAPKRGDLATGFSSGLAGLKSAGGGLLALAGRAAGSQGLEQAGQDYAQEQAALAGQDSRKVEDLFRPDVAPLERAGEGIDFVQYALGQALPSILLSIVGGGVGGIAARTATKALATQATREVVKRAGFVGAAAGAGTTSTAIEAGSIFPEAVETGVSDPVARSVVGGTAAGALDVLPQFYLARRLGLFGKALRGEGREPGAGALARSVVAEGTKTAGLEAATEGAQTVIERVAAGQDLDSPEALSEILNAAAVGGVAGGAFGGVAGAVSPVRQPAPAPEPGIAGLLPPPVETGGAQPDYEAQRRTMAAEERAAQLYAERDAEEARRAAAQVATAPLPALDTGLGLQVPEVARDLNTAQEPLPRPRVARQLDFAQRAAEVLPPEPILDPLAGLQQQEATLRAELARPADQRRPKADIIRDLRAIRVQNVPEATEKTERSRVESDVVATSDAPAPSPARQALAVIGDEQARNDLTALAGPALITPEVSTVPRSTSRQPSPARRAEVVGGLAIETVQSNLPLLVEAAGTKSRKTLIQRSETALVRAAEKAAQAPTLEAATKEFREAARTILKGRVNEADADTFAETAVRAMYEAPTLYSRGAVEPVGPDGKRESDRQAATLDSNVSEFTAQVLSERAAPSTVLQGAKQWAKDAGLNEGQFRRALYSKWRDDPSAQLRAQANSILSAPEAADSRSAQANPTQTPEFSSAPLPEHIQQQIRAHGVEPATLKRITTQEEFKDYARRYGPPTSLSNERGVVFGRQSALFVDDSANGNPVAVAVVSPRAAESQAAQLQAVEFRDTVLITRGREVIAELKRVFGEDGLEYRLYEAEPGDPVGRYTRTGPMKALIELAFNAKDVLSTGYHEGFHFLERQKMTAAERAVVRSALRPGTRLFAQVLARARAYDLANKTFLADEVLSKPEEAHAYGFEFWRKGELQADGALAKVWQKLLNLIERIRNFVSGQGFQSIEDIFEAIDKAAFADRPVLRAGNVTLTSAANRGEWYHSALLKGVAALASNQASPQGWKDAIKGLVNKGQAKQDEVEAVGVNEWLDTQRGRVTKQQVMDFLGENGVRVEEVMLGGESETAATRVVDRARVELDALGYTLEDNGTEELFGVRRRSDGAFFSDNPEAERGADFGGTFSDLPENVREIAVRAADIIDLADDPYSVANSRDDETRYSQYTLPGGKNYRELLLTLPEKKPLEIVGSMPKGWEVRPREEILDGNGNIEAWATKKYYVLDERTDVRGEGDTVAEAIAEANKTIIVDREMKDVSERPMFTSSHFDQPNILAHVRFNERTDADGKRVLFVEEIQSDWAQKGKREGFAKDTTGWTAEPIPVPSGGFNHWLVKDSAGNEITKIVGSRTPEGAIGKAAEGIPAAPFVTKTEAWVGLALKRMIRYAAEQGFDRVAWTTGEQQAERYDLSKHVDLVAWKEEGGILNIRRRGDPLTTPAGLGISAAKLVDHIGKDAADKLMSVKPETDGFRVIRGLDLKVGGEGMRAFYDKIVLNVANDILKKLGGGKVSDVHIRLSNKLGEQASAEDQIRRMNNRQPGFNISPALRDKVLLDSVPLFSRSAQLTPDESREMARRYAAGELTDTQFYDAVAGMVDRANWRDTRKFFSAVGEAGPASVRDFFHKHFATQNYVARHSEGFKNVQQVLRTLIQRKSTLITQGSREGLRDWHTASQADIDEASKALAEADTYSSNAKEPADLDAIRGRLNATQRSLFEQARLVVADRLNREFEVERREREAILEPEEMAKWVADRQAQIASMIEHGYIPKRRYGDHTVHIYLPSTDGKPPFTVYYEQFEERAEALLAQRVYADMIAREAPDLRVEYGQRHRVERDTSLSLTQFLDAARRHGVELTQTEKERVAKALVKADSLRLNRIFRRKNVPGESRDMMRVLHEFVVLTSNKIAHLEMSQAINDAIDGKAVDARLENQRPVIKTDAKRDLWREDGPRSGFYRNLADDMVDYVMTPDHGGQWFTRARTGAMLYFIGGSLASGAVNLMSLPMNTLPWLTQSTSYTNAMSTTLSAFKWVLANQSVLRDINKLKDRSTPMPGVSDDLREALILAAEDGTTQDTEIHQIMGLTQGGMLARSRRVQKAMEAWMFPFRWTEQVNRLSSFVAGYRVGKENGLTGRELYDFAKSTVDNTQNRYDEANRPGVARHPIGAMLFMFKSFPLFIIEMLLTLHKQSPRSAAFMLGGLVALAGVNGLPFAEPLQDLIDTIAQRLFGSPFNTRRWMRNTLKDVSEFATGMDLSDVLLRGVINSTLDINIASRVGLGDFVPGTRLGAADSSYARVAEQLLGAPVAMITGIAAATPKLLKGELLEALRAGGPSAVRNVIKGYEQATTGEARDAGGRKLMDVTGVQALWQSMGFSSATLARLYDLDMIDKQTAAFYSMVRDDFADALTKAVRSGDTAKAQEIVEAIRAWNESYPQMPIGFAPSVMRRRIVEAGMPLNERTLRNLPRALRGTSLATEGMVPQ